MLGIGALGEFAIGEFPPPVSVSIAGVGITAAAGALKDKNDASATGSAVASAAGSASGQVAPRPSGATITAAAGLSKEAVSLAQVGASCSVSSGSAISSVKPAPAGVALTVAVNSPSLFDLAANPIGDEVAAEVGSPIPSLAPEDTAGASVATDIGAVALSLGPMPFDAALAAAAGGTLATVGMSAVAVAQSGIAGLAFGEQQPPIAGMRLTASAAGLASFDFSTTGTSGVSVTALAGLWRFSAIFGLAGVAAHVAIGQAASSGPQGTPLGAAASATVGTIIADTGGAPPDAAMAAAAGDYGFAATTSLASAPISVAAASPAGSVGTEIAGTEITAAPGAFDLELLAIASSASATAVAEPFLAWVLVPPFGPGVTAEIGTVIALPYAPEIVGAGLVASAGTLADAGTLGLAAAAAVARAGVLFSRIGISAAVAASVGVTIGSPTLASDRFARRIIGRSGAIPFIGRAGAIPIARSPP